MAAIALALIFGIMLGGLADGGPGARRQTTTAVDSQQQPQVCLCHESDDHQGCCPSLRPEWAAVVVVVA